MPLIPMPADADEWMGSPFLYIHALPARWRAADRVVGRLRAAEGQRRRRGPLPRLRRPRAPTGFPDRTFGRISLRHPRPRPGGAELLRVAGLVTVRGEGVRDQDAGRPNSAASAMESAPRASARRGTAGTRRRSAP